MEKIEINAVGCFELKSPQCIYYLIDLIDLDEQFIKAHCINPARPEKNEIVLRFQTRRTATIGKESPLVKINTKKKLIYFLAPPPEDRQKFSFEKKGIKALYIDQHPQRFYSFLT